MDLNTITAIITALLGAFWAYLTWRVSKSTDKNTEQTLEINKRLEEMEKRSEAPAVFLTGNQYTTRPNKICIEGATMIKIFLQNMGSSPALNVELKNININKTIKINNQEKINIPANKYFPDIESFIARYGTSQRPEDTLSINLNKLEMFSESAIDGIYIFELSYLSITKHLIKTNIALKLSGSEIDIISQEIIN